MRKKGFAFILDVFISVFIVFSILKIANFYISPNIDSGGIDVNMLNKAFDTVKLLEINDIIVGDLSSLDVETVKVEINKLLPDNYGMYINVTKHQVVPQTFEVSSENIGIPQDKNSVYGNKYYFVDYESNFIKIYEVEYFIWQK